MFESNFSGEKKNSKQYLLLLMIHLPFFVILQTQTLGCSPPRHWWKPTPTIWWKYEPSWPSPLMRTGTPAAARRCGAARAAAPTPPSSNMHSTRPPHSRSLCGSVGYTHTHLHKKDTAIMVDCWEAKMASLSQNQAAEWFIISMISLLYIMLSDRLNVGLYCLNTW